MRKWRHREITYLVQSFLSAVGVRAGIETQPGWSPWLLVTAPDPRPISQKPPLLYLLHHPPNVHVFLSLENETSAVWSLYLSSLLPYWVFSYKLRSHHFPNVLYQAIPSIRKASLSRE